MKKLARNVAIILLTLSVLVLLWELRDAVILFLLSIWFAAAARPMVSWLEGRRVRRGIAILLVYLVVLLVIGGLVYFSSSSLLKEVQALSNRLIASYNHIWQDWPQGSAFQKLIVARLPEPDRLFNFATPGQNSLSTSVFGAASSLFTFLGQIGIALVMSIYWTSDQVRFERVWLSLLPAETRVRAREMWRDVEERIGAYTRSELVQGIGAGILLGMGLTLMHVPYPTLLALVGALAWLVPWVGLVFILGLVLFAASSVSPLMMLVAGIYTLALLLFMELVVEPRLFERQRFSTLLTLLFVIAFGSYFGVIGIVIAPPFAAAIQLIGRYVQTRPTTSLTDESMQRIVELDQHLAALQEKLEKVDESSPQMMSLVQRLNELTDRAKEVMEVEQRKGKLPTTTETQEIQTPYPGKITMR